MTGKPTPSVRIFTPRPDALIRLFCFPYSGGSAQIFKDWGHKLPSYVEVCAIQMPGRAGRFRDTRYLSVEAAIADISGEMESMLGKPFALFGHSLGATLAFEMGRALQARSKTPNLVIPSGMMGPRNPSKEPAIYHLPDNEFKAKLREFNGTPKEVMEHEELMDLVLPILKADFTMADTYVYQEGPLLSCPIYALGGDNDPHTDEEGICDWGNYTTSSFSYDILVGDHFFIHSQEHDVIDRVKKNLDQVISKL